VGSGKWEMVKAKVEKEKVGSRVVTWWDKGGKLKIVKVKIGQRGRSQWKKERELGLAGTGCACRNTQRLPIRKSLVTSPRALCKR